MNEHANNPHVRYVQNRTNKNNKQKPYPQISLHTQISNKQCNSNPYSLADITSNSLLPDPMPMPLQGSGVSARRPRMTPYRHDMTSRDLTCRSSTRSCLHLTKTDTDTSMHTASCLRGGSSLKKSSAVKAGGAGKATKAVSSAGAFRVQVLAGSGTARPRRLQGTLELPLRKCTS